MEIVFTDKRPDIFDENKITGFYGDVIDLVNLGVDIEGIIYDDEWTVRRFLNGLRLRVNPRIISIFKYLDLDESLLKMRIKYLSKTDFKYVLLAYLLLNNKKTIIFDYFDIGLTYKEQKKIIKIMRSMKKDGITVIVISNDLVFMDLVVDSIQVVKNHKIVYNGKLIDLINSDEKIVSEPEIIKFINMANKKGAKLDYTLDSKELLKDIYRSVY